MQFRRLTAAAALIVAACSPTERPQQRDPAPVRRVVTLAPNLTEIVAAIGAEERLVGTDDYSDFPPSVKGLRKVGGLTPSLEAIAALQPDLVIAPASANAPALESALSSLRIPLLAVRADRLDDVPAAMLQLGNLLGVSRGAQRAADQLRDAVGNERRRRTPTPRVLVVAWPDPLYVAGRETFADDLLELVGAVNAVPPPVNGWPQFSLEAVVAGDPDAVVVFGRAAWPDPALDAMRRDPRWAALPAVRSGKLFVVDEDRFSRPGPRLAEAAAELNAILDRAEGARP